MRKLGIIAIGYNRPESLNRLLTLLSLADYRSDAVDIIISLDYSGVEELPIVLSGSTGTRLLRSNRKGSDSAIIF